MSIDLFYRVWLTKGNPTVKWLSPIALFSGCLILGQLS